MNSQLQANPRGVPSSPRLGRGWVQGGGQGPASLRPETPFEQPWAEGPGGQWEDPGEGLSIRFPLVSWSPAPTCPFALLALPVTQASCRLALALACGWMARGQDGRRWRFPTPSCLPSGPGS